MRHGLGLVVAVGCALGAQAVYAQDPAPAAEDSQFPVATDPQPNPAAEQASPAEAEQASPPLAEAAAKKIESVPPLAPPEVKAPQPAKAQGDEPVQLDDIVVTATKREQALEDIPGSIAALSGADLERSGVQGVEDVAKLVPGVTFSNDSVNASKVTIRGISTTTLGNPTTGALFGDVSFTDAYLPRVTLDPNPFDMQSVEVLKGPQGTLFGSAALNGAVRYVPQAPKFGEFETRWFAQYSMVNQGGAAPMYGAAVNLPWGDDVALRAMAFKRKSAGWIDNTRTDETDINSLDQQGARGILGWRPGAAWDVRLTYVWQQTKIRDTGFADGSDGTLTRDTTTKPSPIDSQYNLADGVVRYSFEGMDLISDSAYVGKRAHKMLDTSTDLTGSTVPYVLLEDTSDSQTYSQELRLVSTDSDSPWRWVAGVVGSHQKLFFVPEYSTPVVPGLDVQALLAGLGLSNTDGVLTNGDSVNLLRVLTQAKFDELALFGDLTRTLGDFELSFGGRLYQSKSDGHVLQDGALVLLKGHTQVINDGNVNASGFNPKASVLWHANDDINLYTAVSKGFRNGGLQPGFTTALSAKQAPDRFTSDSLWNYELGTRTRWLHNTLHADATAFYIDWKNPQILLGDSVLHLPYLDNVGRVKSIGVETALQWLLPWVPGLSLNASAAYIRTQTAEAFVGQTGAELPSGTPWPYASRWQTATTLAYTHEFGDWRAGTGLTHTYLSGAYADLEQTLPLFGYRQLDAQMSLNNLAIRWLPEISVSLNNLTDERGIANVTQGGLVTKTVKTTYIQPRALLLRLSGSF